MMKMKIITAEEICEEIELEIGYKADWKKRVKRLRAKKYVLWDDVKNRLKEQE